MKRWAVSFLIAAVAVLLLPMALLRANTTYPTVVYFPQTGHHVGGPFLNYWRGHGGLAVYGFPLTEAFSEVSPFDGKSYTVQYFERARLEAHPENPAPHDMQLGQLGRTMAERILGSASFRPVDGAAVAVDANRVYFPETGHTLQGAFLRYWNAGGGLAQFGYPISEEFFERSPVDGKVYTVQYFERNRFELHPENQAPYDVLLGLLGRQVAQERGLNMTQATRQAGVPDYEERLFFTPTPIPTATPTATPIPPEPTPQPRPASPGGTYIEVNLSEQYLYAWEDGKIVYEVAISSGKRDWETPTGTFSIFSKVRVEDMRGNDPALEDGVYFQPDVPWVMYFADGGFAIHGVYWHNSFGTPRSHGCVGAPVGAAQWLYNWAPIGTRVHIHY